MPKLLWGTSDYRVVFIGKNPDAPTQNLHDLEQANGKDAMNQPIWIPVGGVSSTLIRQLGDYFLKNPPA